MSRRREAALQDSYLVFLMMGGFDAVEGGGYLTAMDYLGNQFEAPHLAQGFGGRFSTSIMDSLYRPDMSVDEAIAALQRCINDVTPDSSSFPLFKEGSGPLQVKKRCAISLPQFEAYAIDKDGIRSVGPLIPA